MKEHVFYPMVNKTIRTLLSIANTNECRLEILGILTTYPDYSIKEDNALIQAVIEELNRQYSRWNKGNDDGASL